MLLNVIKTGMYIPTGGTEARDSTMLAVKTWAQLMQAEAQIKQKNKKSPCLMNIALRWQGFF